jgi:sulfite reductase (ferredoxin)
VDWHDAREYSIGDIGVGECAGEVISLTQFSLATAESKVFDASLIVDDGNATDAEIQEAARTAYAAMVTAAQGLIKTRNPDISGDANVVFETFKTQFIDTQLFLDRFVGVSQWQYFQSAHDARGAARDRDEARRRVEEAQLFIEASHACYARLTSVTPSAAVTA